MLQPVPSSTSLDDAIVLRPLGPDDLNDGQTQIPRLVRFVATVHAGWHIRGIPHGGYLLAMVAAAAAKVGPQPHPVSVAANYLAPPLFGPATLEVTEVRVGKRQSVHQVQLLQEGVPRVHATVTLGTLVDADPVHWNADIAAPAIPSVEECLDIIAVREDTDGEFPLHERLHLRLHPETGWVYDKPNGTPSLDGWMKLTNEKPNDPLGLLVYSDGFPPSIFEALGTDIGHVPTVQLTTHLFALPAPGWVQSRCRTRVQGGGFVDEDTELWDSTGRLVGTARQLAMLRTSSPS